MLPLPAFLIADILGVPRAGRRKFQQRSEYIAKYARDIEYAALRNTNQVYNDLISQFIAAEEQGDRLTSDEIYSTGALLLIAGHETTTRLIGNALWLLLTHADQLQLLRDDPDRFDITRENIRHVGFGYGVHLCLGAELARLETKTMLRVLLERFPAIALKNDTPAWGDSDFVRGLDELLVSV